MNDHDTPDRPRPDRPPSDAAEARAPEGAGQDGAGTSPDRDDGAPRRAGRGKWGRRRATRPRAEGATDAGASEGSADGFGEGAAPNAIAAAGEGEAQVTGSAEGGADPSGRSPSGRARRPRRGPPERAAAGRASADPEQAIPFYARQAPVGLEATDPRRRHAKAPLELDDDETPKLHKVLADAGIGSRRDMEELIIAGRVSVNGQPAYVGQRIGPNDLVRINGKPLRRRVQKSAAKVLLYHKPPGEICSRDDPEQRSSVFDRLPRLKGQRWVAVGRLDFNTEGLLIFTTSGEMANLLMHPRFGWDREYAVRILGRIDDELRERLLAGVPLDDGMASFSAVEDVGGDGANHWYRVTIGEGRNREVRRIFESVGLIVSRLVRIRFGPVALPPALVRGRWVELPAVDVAVLSRLLRQAGQDAPAPGEGAALRASAPGGLAGTRSPDAAGESDDDSGPYSDDDAAWPRGRNPDRAALDADDEFDDEFDDDTVPSDIDEFGRRLPAAGAVVPRKGPEVNLEDDEWQPKAADAHLSGITRTVRKSTRERLPGGFPGMPVRPDGPGKKARRPKKSGKAGPGARGGPPGAGGPAYPGASFGAEGNGAGPGGRSKRRRPPRKGPPGAGPQAMAAGSGGGAGGDFGGSPGRGAGSPMAGEGGPRPEAGRKSGRRPGGRRRRGPGRGPGGGEGGAGPGSPSDALG
jgi:23S rRNA pseudouridine2605 synthase